MKARLKRCLASLLVLSMMLTLVPMTSIGVMAQELPETAETQSVPADETQDRKEAMQDEPSEAVPVSVEQSEEKPLTPASAAPTDEPKSDFVQKVRNLLKDILKTFTSKKSAESASAEPKKTDAAASTTEAPAKADACSELIPAGSLVETDKTDMPIIGDEASAEPMGIAKPRIELTEIFSAEEKSTYSVRIKADNRYEYQSYKIYDVSDDTVLPEEGWTKLYTAAAGDGEYMTDIVSFPQTDKKQVLSVYLSGRLVEGDLEVPYVKNGELIVPAKADSSFITAAAGSRNQYALSIGKVEGKSYEYLVSTVSDADMLPTTQSEWTAVTYGAGEETYDAELRGVNYSGSSEYYPLPSYIWVREAESMESPMRIPMALDYVTYNESIENVSMPMPMASIRYDFNDDSLKMYDLKSVKWERSDAENDGEWVAVTETNYLPETTYRVIVTLAPKWGFRLIDEMGSVSVLCKQTNGVRASRYGGIYHKIDENTATVTCEFDPTLTMPAENGTMGYKYCSNNRFFDVQGMVNATWDVENEKWLDGWWKRSTYNDRGFLTYAYVGSDIDHNYRSSNHILSGVEKGTDIAGLNFKVDIKPVLGGDLMQVIYTVENTSEATKTFSLGSGGDVMIGDNDRAEIRAVTNESGDLIGTQLLENLTDGAGGIDEKNSGALSLWARDTAYVTNVDNLWYGYWSGNDNSYWNWSVESGKVMFTGEGANRCVEGETDYDSALAWSWKDRTIGKGEKQVYSVLLGVGTQFPLLKGGSFTALDDDEACVSYFTDAANGLTERMLDFGTAVVYLTRDDTTVVTDGYVLDAEKKTITFDKGLIRSGDSIKVRFPNAIQHERTLNEGTPDEIKETRYYDVDLEIGNEMTKPNEGFCIGLPAFYSGSVPSINRYHFSDKTVELIDKAIVKTDDLDNFTVLKSGEKYIGLMSFRVGKGLHFSGMVQGEKQVEITDTDGNALDAYLVTEDSAVLTIDRDGKIVGATDANSVAELKKGELLVAFEINTPAVRHEVDYTIYLGANGKAYKAKMMDVNNGTTDYLSLKELPVPYSFETEPGEIVYNPHVLILENILTRNFMSIVTEEDEIKPEEIPELTYDTETGVWTMNGLTLETSSTVAIKASSDTTIKLLGKNFLQTTPSGSSESYSTRVIDTVDVSGYSKMKVCDLLLTGDGSLMGIAGNPKHSREQLDTAGIHVGVLTVDGPSVTVYGGSATIETVFDENTKADCNMNSYGIYARDGIVLRDGELNAIGGDIVYQSDPSKARSYGAYIELRDSSDDYSSGYIQYGGSSFFRGGSRTEFDSSEMTYRQKENSDEYSRCFFAGENVRIYGGSVHMEVWTYGEKPQGAVIEASNDERYLIVTGSFRSTYETDGYFVQALAGKLNGGECISQVLDIVCEPSFDDGLGNDGLEDDKAGGDATLGNYKDYLDAENERHYRPGIVFGGWYDIRGNELKATDEPKNTRYYAKWLSADNGRPISPKIPFGTKCVYMEPKNSGEWVRKYEFYSQEISDGAYYYNWCDGQFYKKVDQVDKNGVVSTWLLPVDESDEGVFGCYDAESFLNLRESLLEEYLERIPDGYKFIDDEDTLDSKLYLTLKLKEGFSIDARDGQNRHDYGIVPFELDDNELGRQTCESICIYKNTLSGIVGGYDPEDDYDSSYGSFENISLILDVEGDADIAASIAPIGKDTVKWINDEKNEYYSNFQSMTVIGEGDLSLSGRYACGADMYYAGSGKLDLTVDELNRQFTGIENNGIQHNREDSFYRGSVCGTRNLAVGETAKEGNVPQYNFLRDRIAAPVPDTAADFGYLPGYNVSYTDNKTGRDTVTVQPYTEGIAVEKDKTTGEYKLYFGATELTATNDTGYQQSKNLPKVYPVLSGYVVLDDTTLTFAPDENGNSVKFITTAEKAVSVPNGFTVKGCAQIYNMCSGTNAYGIYGAGDLTVDGGIYVEAALAENCYGVYAKNNLTVNQVSYASGDKTDLNALLLQIAELIDDKRLTPQILELANSPEAQEYLPLLSSVFYSGTTSVAGVSGGYSRALLSTLMNRDGVKSDGMLNKKAFHIGGESSGIDLFTTADDLIDMISVLMPALPAYVTYLLATATESIRFDSSITDRDYEADSDWLKGLLDIPNYRHCKNAYSFYAGNKMTLSGVMCANGISYGTEKAAVFHADKVFESVKDTFCLYIMSNGNGIEANSVKLDSTTVVYLSGLKNNISSKNDIVAVGTYASTADQAGSLLAKALNKGGDKLGELLEDEEIHKMLVELASSYMPGDAKLKSTDLQNAELMQDIDIQSILSLVAKLFPFATSVVDDGIRYFPDMSFATFANGILEALVDTENSELLDLLKIAREQDLLDANNAPGKKLVEMITGKMDRETIYEEIGEYLISVLEQKGEFTLPFGAEGGIEIGQELIDLITWDNFMNLITGIIPALAGNIIPLADEDGKFTVQTDFKASNAMSQMGSTRFISDPVMPCEIFDFDAADDRADGTYGIGEDNVKKLRSLIDSVMTALTDRELLSTEIGALINDAFYMLGTFEFSTAASLCAPGAAAPAAAADAKTGTKARKASIEFVSENGARVALTEKGADVTYPVSMTLGTNTLDIPVIYHVENGKLVGIEADSSFKRVAANYGLPAVFDLTSGNLSTQIKEYADNEYAQAIFNAANAAAGMGKTVSERTRYADGTLYIRGDLSRYTLTWSGVLSVETQSSSAKIGALLDTDSGNVYDSISNFLLGVVLDKNVLYDTFSLDKIKEVYTDLTEKGECEMPAITGETLVGIVTDTLPDAVRALAALSAPKTVVISSDWYDAGDDDSTDMRRYPLTTGYVSARNILVDDADLRVNVKTNGSEYAVTGGQNTHSYISNNHSSKLFNTAYQQIRESKMMKFVLSFIDMDISVVDSAVGSVIGQEKIGLKTIDSPTVLSGAISTSGIGQTIGAAVGSVFDLAAGLLDRLFGGASLTATTQKELELPSHYINFSSRFGSLIGNGGTIELRKGTVTVDLDEAQTVYGTALSGIVGGSVKLGKDLEKVDVRNPYAPFDMEIVADDYLYERNTDRIYVPAVRATAKGITADSGFGADDAQRVFGTKAKFFNNTVKIGGEDDVTIIRGEKSVVAAPYNRDYTSYVMSNAKDSDWAKGDTLKSKKAIVLDPYYMGETGLHQVAKYDGKQHAFVFDPVYDLKSGPLDGYQVWYSKIREAAILGATLYSEFTTDAPVEAGDYMVKITRAEDSTYAALDTGIGFINLLNMYGMQGRMGYDVYTENIVSLEGSDITNNGISMTLRIDRDELTVRNENIVITDAAPDCTKASATSQTNYSVEGIVDPSAYSVDGLKAGYRVEMVYAIDLDVEPVTIDGVGVIYSIAPDTFKIRVYDEQGSEVTDCYSIDTIRETESILKIDESLRMQDDFKVGYLDACGNFVEASKIVIPYGQTIRIAGSGVNNAKYGYTTSYVIRSMEDLFTELAPEVGCGSYTITGSGSETYAPALRTVEVVGAEHGMKLTMKDSSEKEIKSGLIHFDYPEFLVEVSVYGEDFAAADYQLTFDSNRYELLTGSVSAVTDPTTGMTTVSGRSTILKTVTDEKTGETSRTLFNDGDVIAALRFRAKIADDQVESTMVVNGNVCGDALSAARGDAKPAGFGQLRIVTSPKYDLELVSDYVAGYALALLYTDADPKTTPAPTLNGFSMIAELDNNKPYAYNPANGDGKAAVTDGTYCYALVLRNDEKNPLTLAEVKAMLGEYDKNAEQAYVDFRSTTVKGKTLSEQYNVNDSYNVDLYDAVAAMATYNVNSYYFADADEGYVKANPDAVEGLCKQIRIILKADVNRDKVVNVLDVSGVLNNYGAAKEKMPK